MNALWGHAEPQPTHGAGVGYASTRNAVGRYSDATSIAAAAVSARSTRWARPPDEKARIRKTNPADSAQFATRPALYRTASSDNESVASRTAAPVATSSRPNRSNG